MIKHFSKNTASAFIKNAKNTKNAKNAFKMLKMSRMHNMHMQEFLILENDVIF